MTAVLPVNPNNRVVEPSEGADHTDIGNLVAYYALDPVELKLILPELFLQPVDETLGNLAVSQQV